jgi:hypothetical protein
MYIICFTYDTQQPENYKNHILTVSDSRLPQPGGPGYRVYVPQEQGGPVITSGTGFPFRCLLRLTGLRWGYSNPPPHGPLSRNDSCPSLRVTQPLPINRCFSGSTVFSFGKYAAMSNGGLGCQWRWTFCLCFPLMCEPVSRTLKCELWAWLRDLASDLGQLEPLDSILCNS